MFISKLKTRYITYTKNPKEYELKQKLIYKDKHTYYKVPVGFKTDFASVPKGLQFLFKPQGKYSRASILHDYLYDFKVVSRFQADEIFYQAMKEDKVNTFTRILFYLAVRIGGNSYYNRG